LHTLRSFYQPLSRNNSKRELGQQEDDLSSFVCFLSCSSIFLELGSACQCSQPAHGGTSALLLLVFGAMTDVLVVLMVRAQSISMIYQE
jgi:hypothetical protein